MILWVTTLKWWKTEWVPLTSLLVLIFGYFPLPRLINIFWEWFIFLCKVKWHDSSRMWALKSNLISSSFWVFLWTSIENARYEKVPVILVGNKVDLESEREVSSNEGRALAEEWGCPFMETSAKSKTMVDELFAEIVRQMNYAAQPDKDDPCCSACNIQ